MNQTRTFPPCGANASRTTFTKRGAILKVGGRLRIGLLVQRPRRQTGITRTFKRIESTIQRVLHAELTLEDGHDVLATECAHAMRPPVVPSAPPRAQSGVRCSCPAAARQCRHHASSTQSW